MRDDLKEKIHHAIEMETRDYREVRRCGCIHEEQVSYVVHELGVSAYYGDFHIGEFETQTEAIRKVRDMAEHYI